MRKTITWQNFTEGDVIITLAGEQAQVLGKIGKVFARSGWFNFDTFSELISVKDAQKKGWRFIQPGGEVPVTMEDIEKIMGRPIKIIK